MTMRASLQHSFAGIVGAVFAVLLALALAPVNAWAAAPEGIPEDLPTDLPDELYSSDQVVPGIYEPGTYQVTANWYVWKDNNPLGLPVTAFMTNPNNPFGIALETENMLPGTVIPEGGLPSNPVKNNATLVVGENGSLTLTVPILNPVFTLEDVSQASAIAGTAAIINYGEREGAYPHDGTPQFTKRINELTFSLGATAKTSAGVNGYTFAPCGIFGGPSSGFNAYADKPMELSVNFENVPCTVTLPDNGWFTNDASWYYYSNGAYVTGWQRINGSWYYFGTDGIMWTGHHWVNDWPVYFKSSGALHTGWLYEDGTYRYYDANGWMVLGWKKISGDYYYFGTDGIMYTGARDINGTYSVFAQGGQLEYGWCWADGAYYWANSSGYCVTGWNKIGGSWYYMNEQAQMQTGWEQIGSTWYHFAGSGAMDTGWYWNGSRYLYLDASGAMSTGWDKIGSYWYYFNGSGYMQRGWQYLSESWYHFRSSGAMDTGWKVIGGLDYYFYGSGSMAHDTWVGNYYMGSSGAMLVNTTTPDGYQVDEHGKWVA